MQREAFSRMSSESFSYNSINNNKSSDYVKERSVTTKMIGGGEHRRFIEHFTKSFRTTDRGCYQDKSRIDVPKWMEERKSPRTKQRDVDISDINVS